MFGLLRKIANAFSRRSHVWPVERWLADRYRGIARKAPADGSAPLVMVEAVENLFFYSLQGEIVSALRASRPVRVARWASHSLNNGAARSLPELIAGRLQGWIVSRVKWARLYDAFCDAGSDRADYVRAPWRELSWAWRAWRIFCALDSKDQLAAIRERDILIGDLVIDSYLRFRPSPEILLDDWYLFAVLRQAIKDVHTVDDYFRKVRPAVFLTTYATYIQHGIPARVAVARGIPTWSFANAQEFSTRLSPDHLFHTKRVAGYCRDFDRLPDREAKRALASDYLGARVSGIADTATANQASAYATKTANVPDVRGAAVVFLHDFYDSAHIYRWMVFHDFWEWTCVTIDVLRAAGLPFFVKAHPNQRSESLAEMERLQEKYPDLRIVAPDVGNRQMVDAGMACAITVYGSVAAEMAYLGVPSIACADNPHASFDSFHLARTREEYGDLLRGFRELPRDPIRMKAQACAFYYMHNLNISSEEQALRDLLIGHFLGIVRLEEREDLIDLRAFEQSLTRLTTAPAFRAFITDVATALS